jgi:hypothetical protein
MKIGAEGGVALAEILCDAFDLGDAARPWISRLRVDVSRRARDILTIWAMCSGSSILLSRVRCTSGCPAYSEFGFNGVSSYNETVWRSIIRCTFGRAGPRCKASRRS